MADFALNNNGLGYDVDFSRRANGKRDLRIVRGQAAVAQRLQMRFRTFLGECRYNRIAGVPWTQVIFTKGITANAIHAVLEQHALNTLGVVRVLSFDIFPDFRTRSATGEVRLLGTTGDQPFSVPLEIRGQGAGQ